MRTNLAMDLGGCVLGFCVLGKLIKKYSDKHDVKPYTVEEKEKANKLIFDVLQSKTIEEFNEKRNKA